MSYCYFLFQGRGVGSLDLKSEKFVEPLNISGCASPRNFLISLYFRSRGNLRYPVSQHHFSLWGSYRFLQSIVKGSQKRPLNHSLKAEQKKKRIKYLLLACSSQKNLSKSGILEPLKLFSFMHKTRPCLSHFRQQETEIQKQIRKVSTFRDFPGNMGQVLDESCLCFHFSRYWGLDFKSHNYASNMVLLMLMSGDWLNTFCLFCVTCQQIV